MIKTTDTSLLNDIEDYSVIINPCCTKGWMGTGMSYQIARKWPDAFMAYHNYCAWFLDGHEDEIMGTFVGTPIGDKLIICDVIVNQVFGKASQHTNTEAWEKICSNIERQTRKINKRCNLNWTLHLYEKALQGQNILETDAIKDIFEYHFKDSPVKVVFHKY